MNKLICSVFVFYFATTISHAQSNSWTQRASLPGVGRAGSMGFSLNGSGYVICGLTAGSNTLTDLWKWNQTNNTWTQKANFPGIARHSHVAFKVGNKGYVSTGITSGNILLNDLWEYNPGNNTWSQKQNFFGVSRYFATSFEVGNYAYVGLGYVPVLKDLWRYDPAINTWTQMADLPGGARQGAKGFAINNNGYIVCGYTGVSQKELWRYNVASNSWLLRSEFPGSARYQVGTFVLNGKGYVGTGTAVSGNVNDFYCYDPATDSWSPAATLPSNARQSATCFSINGRGYISCGVNVSNFYNDLWEYNPGALFAYVTGTNNTCIGLDNGSAKAMATGGVAPIIYLWNNGKSTANIANLAAGTYTVTVHDNTGVTVTASATLIAPNPMTATTPLVAPICKGDSVTLSVTVSGGIPPYTYSWSPSSLSGQVIKIKPSVSATYTVYIYDANGCSIFRTVWVVVTPLPSAPIHISNGGVVCSPDSVKLYSSSNSSLSWQWVKNGVFINGATDSVYYAKTTGTYKVIVTNATGCSRVSSLASVNITALAVSINPAGTVSICQGDSVNLNAIPSTGFTYKWKRNGSVISGATQSTYKAKLAGTYKVFITDPVAECTGSSAPTSVIINCRNSNEELVSRVFPNPAKDQFTVDLTALNIENIMEIDVTDLTGKLIKNYSVKSKQDYITFGKDLLPGIYFMKLKSQSGFQVVRIAKQE